jgi:DNA polymerase III subunit delta'
MPSTLATVKAQPTAVETLRRALAGDRVHHAYLFDGPEGVGKERAAFGLAQALVCERRASGSAEACGVCSACTRSQLREGERRPVHPDVAILERGLYDKDMIGRTTPETQDISINQVRTIVLARAAFPPHEGRAKVFIVRRAEELSIPAANALLKTLEEPGQRTHFVLLSATPDALLPTIRSRTQRVRFAPLPDAVVVELLVERGTERARAEEIAVLAGGSMSTAATLADPDASEQREQFVKRAMGALASPDAGEALDLAADAKGRDKDAVTRQLEALAAALGAEARSTAKAADRRADVAAARHGLAVAAVQQLEGNAAAQLALEAMLIRMRAV